MLNYADTQKLMLVHQTDILPSSAFILTSWKTHGYKDQAPFRICTPWHGTWNTWIVHTRHVLCNARANATETVGLMKRSVINCDHCGHLVPLRDSEKFSFTCIQNFCQVLGEIWVSSVWKQELMSWKLIFNVLVVKDQIIVSEFEIKPVRRTMTG